MWLPVSETDPSKISPLFGGYCVLDLVSLKRGSTNWNRAKNEGYFVRHYSPPTGCSHNFNKTKVDGTTRLYHAFSSKGSPSNTIAFLNSSPQARRAFGKIYGELLPPDFDTKMHVDPPVDPPTYEAPKTRIMGRGRAQTTPSVSKKRKGDDDDNNNRSATKKDVRDIISQYATSSTPSTTSSRSSDERDAETIVSYIKKRMLSSAGYAPRI